jgi:cobalt/nickel transport system ATP-binding protein
VIRSFIYMSKTIIKISCIKYIYPDKTEVKICGLDFEVSRGEKVALIGANGSGKSTLIYHCLGLLEPTEGKVEVFGVNPAKNFSAIGKKIGIVVQNAEDQLIGPTVFDDIAFSLVNYGFPKKEIGERVNAIIKSLKIEHLKEKIVHYLSGGEKKKVALAGAMVLEPEFLVLDEALAEIDPLTTEILLQELNEMARDKNTAILMATNDMHLVEKFADTVYLLEKGGVTFKGTYAELMQSGKAFEICKH